MVSAFRFVALLLACLVSGSACFAPTSALRSAQPQQRSASVVMMPKAATKPMRVNARNREYNKQYRSEMRTRIKRVRAMHFFRIHASPVCRRARCGGLHIEAAAVLRNATCVCPSSQVLEATELGDYQVAVPTLSKAFAIIDKNVKRGIIHKNTAARKKSQLHLKVCSRQAPQRHLSHPCAHLRFRQGSSSSHRFCCPSLSQVKKLEGTPAPAAAAPASE